MCKIGKHGSKYGGCTVFLNSMEKEMRRILVHKIKY
jgi:hypothetical protein